MNTGEFFDKVESLYKDWQYDHPRVLYSLIKLLKPERVLEVGTFIGYGACYMARALQENGKGHLFCIDNWQLPNPAWRAGSVKEHFERSLSECGVRDLVTLIEGDSLSIPFPDSIDFAYIDGWHSYDSVRSDFERCHQAGARVICLDDAISVVGPRMLVDDLRGKGEWNVVQLPSAAGLAICTRLALSDITFSQELPLPNPGVCIDTLSADQRAQHFRDATEITGNDYSRLYR